MLLIVRFHTNVSIINHPALTGHFVTSVSRSIWEFSNCLIQSCPEFSLGNRSCQFIQRTQFAIFIQEISIYVPTHIKVAYRSGAEYRIV